MTLFNTSDDQLVSYVSVEAYPDFTDHSIVTVNTNLSLGKKAERKDTFLLDSGRRLRQLDFNKAPWPAIKKELQQVNWSKIACKSPTAAHSWFLCQVLPI